MPQTLQARVATTLGKRFAKDTVDKYNEDYDPVESYWVVENGKKKHKKHWKKSHWSDRDIYYPDESVLKNDAEVLAHFRKWAWRFDMWFYHWTCGMTIGIGAILGLIPVIGDFADLVVGLVLIEHIKKKITMTHKGEVWDEEKNKRFVRVLNKMRASVLLAAGVGVIPFFGDIFDAVYKANTRNVWLLENFLVDEAHRAAAVADLEKASVQPAQPARSHRPREGR